MRSERGTRFVGFVDRLLFSHCAKGHGPTWDWQSWDFLRSAEGMPQEVT